MDTTAFCTLFDSGYIDRGITMYQSLEKVCEHFVLYVIAFDSICYDVLVNEKFRNMIVISLQEFENEELLKAKSNRTRREYMWSCSGYSIKYVLDKYKEDSCTYIDADMLFYKDPAEQVRKIQESGCDVGIIAHGFGRHPEYVKLERMAGKYCVEFNTFLNTENGRGVLDWWISECMNYCVETPDGKCFGDQKYLDEFEKLFSGIYVHNNFGLGVAPWNVDRFLYVDEYNTIMDRNTKEKETLIFYHFHSLRVTGENGADIITFIRPGKHDKKLVYHIYRPYLQQLFSNRKYLSQQYNISWEYSGYLLKRDGIKERISSFFGDEKNPYMRARMLFRYIFNKSKDLMEV